MAKTLEVAPPRHLMTTHDIEPHLSPRFRDEDRTRIREICDAHADGVSKAWNNQDLKASAIEAIVLSREEIALQQLDEVRSAAIEAARRSFDQAEGEIRAAYQPKALTNVSTMDQHFLHTYRRLEQQEVLMRGRVLLDTLQATSEIDETEDLVDEAVLQGDGQIARAAFAVARAKLQALAAAVPRPDASDRGALEAHAAHPAVRAARRLAERFTQFRNEHPSAVQRLRAIEQEREARTAVLDSDVNIVAKLLLGSESLTKARDRVHQRALLAQRTA